MDRQNKFDKLIEQYPHPTKSFYARPHLTRRHFFQLAGAGISCSFLANRLPAAPVISTSGSVSMKSTAKNVVFILLAGAPSHTDTFDLKMIDGITPTSFNPATVNNVFWPTGLMPKLGAQMGDIAIVRSMRAWALVHGLGQNWVQIGRNPAAVLGNISPNIGSVVAIEKEHERKPTQVFPTFLALNSSSGAGPGYFNSEYAPFRVSPSTAGIANTANNSNGTAAGSQQRFNDRFDLLHHLDDSLRQNSPYGKPMEDYDKFYQAAQGMMYNPTVSKAFTYSPADSLRYGSTSFGNALLVAKQVLSANEGTRFIQVTQGGWDMHQNIYQQAQLPTMTKLLDDGLGTFITDLKASGQLDSTLIVMLGEFGRTTGKVTAAGGRDHFLQQFAMFAGGGVKGGKTIGSTDSTGSMTVDSGWSRQRDIKPEDVEATIYSAMGIDWTTIRHDDPLGRGFYYVPSSDQDIYGPINELWA